MQWPLRPSGGPSTAPAREGIMAHIPHPDHSDEPRHDPAALSRAVQSLVTLTRLLARQAAREHLLNHSEPSEERHEAIDQY